MSPRTKFIVSESPTNPHLSVVDIERFADIGRNPADRERAMKALRQHMESLAPRLPDGQTLKLEVLDVEWDHALGANDLDALLLGPLPSASARLAPDDAVLRAADVDVLQKRQAARHALGVVNARPGDGRGLALDICACSNAIRVTCSSTMVASK